MKLKKIDFLLGRLDRYSSEQRLRNTGKLGSYLVRESDRKPGSYVLSYLGRTGINHFRYKNILQNLLNRLLVIIFL